MDMQRSAPEYEKEKEEYIFKNINYAQPRLAKMGGAGALDFILNSPLGTLDMPSFLASSDIEASASDDS